MEAKLLKVKKLREIRVSILNRKKYQLKKQLDAKCEERKILFENKDGFSFLYRTYSDDTATKDTPLKSYKLSIQAMSTYRDTLLNKIRLSETKIQHINDEENLLVSEINEVDEAIVAVRKSDKKMDFLLEISNEND